MAGEVAVKTRLVAASERLSPRRELVVLAYTTAVMINYRVAIFGAG